MEGLIPTLFGADAVEIPGARSLCASLSAASPEVPWAIVTSGTCNLVDGWLRILSLPTPHHLVTAESVEHGKPDPQGYLMGAKALGLDPKSLLVLEDSPAGIKAGKDAGCRVLGVATTHTAQQVKDAGADWVVEDLRSVTIARTEEDGSVALSIASGWTGN
jgi:glycerol 3-phosphatase-1